MTAGERTVAAMAAEQHVSADDLANLLVGVEAAKVRQCWQRDEAIDARSVAVVNAAKAAAARAARDRVHPASSSPSQPATAAPAAATSHRRRWWRWRRRQHLIALGRWRCCSAPATAASGWRRWTWPMRASDQSATRRVTSSRPSRPRRTAGRSAHPNILFPRPVLLAPPAGRRAPSLDRGEGGVPAA